MKALDFVKSIKPRTVLIALAIIVPLEIAALAAMAHLARAECQRSAPAPAPVSNSCEKPIADALAADEEADKADAIRRHVEWSQEYQREQSVKWQKESNPKDWFYFEDRMPKVGDRIKCYVPAGIDPGTNYREARCYSYPLLKVSTRELEWCVEGCGQTAFPVQYEKTRLGRGARWTYASE